jgi:CPA1 family monovalent cation:H+ antiporter
MTLTLPEMIIAAVGLLFIASLSAVGFRRLQIPYTVGLVLVGIVFYYICGQVPQLYQFRELRLNHDLIMYALLPSLIFSASVNIDSKLLFRNFNPAFMLAGPGLVVSTFVISFIMYYFTPMNLAASLLFGALISATDPVAVISLFELVGAPKRLRILVDGESLFNDATAIVMFTLVQKVLFAGAAFSMMTLGVAAYEFMFIFFGGLLVGAITGYIMVQIILLVKDDPMVEIALSAIVAYTAFIFADRVLEVSGVMACLGAGVVISHYSSSRFTPRTQNYLKRFWEFISFIANSYIFLLLGFTEDFYLFGSEAFNLASLKSIAWAIIAIQVSRAVIVFGICPFMGLRDKDKKIDWKYQLLMFWGGLRGAVPLALVFSLPEGLQHRMLVVQVTLGVVIFTLLVQGGTISKLLKIFKLDRASLFKRFSEAHALLLARERGLSELTKLAGTWDFPPDVVGELENKYREKIKDQRTEMAEIVQNKEEEKRALRRSIWTQVLNAERYTFRELFESGFINEHLFRELDFYMDQQLETVISTGALPPPIIRELFKKRPVINFLNRLRHWSFGKKNQAYHLNQEYLCCCALAIGVLGARERLAELEKDDFFKGYPEGIEQCAKFYDKGFKQIQQRLKELEEKHLEIMSTIASTTLQQMVYSNELNAIEELLENEEISERIYSHLSAFFHQRIKENSKRVYQKILEG